MKCLCDNSQTLENSVISPNFLVWKFCGKDQLPHSLGRIAGNYAGSEPFHKVSTPENYVKLQYFTLGRQLLSHKSTNINVSQCLKYSVRAMGQINSNLPVTVPEWRQWRRFGAIIVKFEELSYFAIKSILLTLSMLLEDSIFWLRSRLNGRI